MPIIYIVLIAGSIAMAFNVYTFVRDVKRAYETTELPIKPSGPATAFRSLLSLVVLSPILGALLLSSQARRSCAISAFQTMMPDGATQDDLLRLSEALDKYFPA